MLKVYIGHDRRELEAVGVAHKTLIQQSSIPVSVTYLELERLTRQGLMRRPLEGRMDVISDAAQSTDFATSRFLVPILAQSGWALFVDCDVVFMGDVAELMALADPRYAAMCVQHPVFTGSRSKMDGQVQSFYPRKNWSSVVLWNCAHPAHKRLTLDVVNGSRGRELHYFWWLKDEEIGRLPSEWNWLVNLQDKPEAPKLAHFTLGGPFTPNWPGAPNDDIWLNAANQPA